MSTTIRVAVEKDKAFLIHAIMEAEKSGSNMLSYCAIFSIPEKTVAEMLSNILDEGIDGQELYIPNFLIAEMDGTPAATCSAWIEQENGMASKMIKSNLLMYFLERDVLLNAQSRLTVLNELSIDRTPAAMQIECVYTDPRFRGRGLTRQLIDEHIRLKQASGILLHEAEIQLLKNNESAIKAYEKAGFKIAVEKTTASKEILKLLPSDTKILMKRNLIN
jgi:ribosomal protein S18 acetylase RimI-like enzyme